MAEQARSDRFYELVNSEEWTALPGASAVEIAARLGEPQRVESLSHEGHTWIQIVYEFDAIPSEATPEETEAYGRGMRFAPTLLFRDGVCVTFDDYVREVLGGILLNVQEVRFRPGGTFP